MHITVHMYTIVILSVQFQSQIFVAYDAPEIHTTMWLKMCVNWCVPCGWGGGRGGKGVNMWKLDL